MKHKSFDVVRMFEENMAEYVGSKYAVAVDNCTNAIRLCCMLFDKTTVRIPKHTYISVVQSCVQAGYKVELTDEKWRWWYNLKPLPIVDAAPTLFPNMYYDGHILMCVSFGIKKPLKIGKGGMIFTNSEEYYNRLKRLRWSGRKEDMPLGSYTIRESQFGFNSYMLPEQAARGMMLLEHYHPPAERSGYWCYDDISQYLLLNKNE